MSTGRKGTLLLFAGVSMMAVSGASVAQAQTVDADQAQPTTQQQQQPASEVEPRVADQNASNYGEIVVTAQRRAERLLDVPITLTAVTPEALESFAVTNTTDLPSLVPGLVFTQGLTNANPYMRGIGQQLDGINIEQPVAVYIDGVYLFQPASAIFSFNNVSQIEVLKGPQGTLFGRNALGGVIHVKTEEPKRDPVLKVDASYGNYDTITGHFYANTPVSQDVTVNLAAYGMKRMRGYGFNVTRNKRIYQAEEYGAQGKIRWQAGDATEILLNALYSHVTSDIGGTTGVVPGALAEDGVTRFISTYKVADSLDTTSPTNTFLGSLRITHDLGWAKLISITAYHKLWAKLTLYVNAIPFGSGKALSIDPFHLDAHTFTQEVQLQGGNGDKFNWIFGLYYLHDVSKNRFSPALDGTEFFSLDATMPADSYSAFGQATMKVLPATNLTLGFRYTQDRKSISGVANSGGFIFGPEDTGIETKKSWGSPSWRVALDHKLAPNVMAFVSYNRGFASGTYNSTDFANPAASPETLDAFEGGVKSEMFDRRVSLNVAGFYYIVNDLQQVSLTPGLGRTGSIALFNAASSRIYGTDVDFTIRPVDNFSVTGGFQLLHAKYRRFPDGACPVPSPAGGNPTTDQCDLSGRQMNRAPKFAATIGAQYTTGPLQFSINNSHNSGFNWEPSALVKQKAYDSLSGSITWSAPGDKWQIQLYGSNLLDEKIWAYAAAASTSVYSPGVPRLYGVRVSAKF